MSHEEQVCWSFDLMPSQYEDLIWSHIWYDVTYRIKLKIDTVSTNHLQYYNSMADIVSSIFGEDKKNKPEPKKVNDMAPDQAVQELNDLFKMIGGG